MSIDLFLVAHGIINGQPLTEELLDEVVAKLRQFASQFAPDTAAGEFDAIRRRLESTIGVTTTVGDTLRDDGQVPWLEDAKASIDWAYWDAYAKDLLLSEWPPEVIRVLDEDTDNILNECGDPQAEGPWRVQGLVMGDVQSGKTASYCGLINKAADAGYRVIVLLTGMIEDLRSQSQERMDAGFVGRESKELLEGRIGTTKIGAGRFREAVPNVLTSVERDFLTSNMRALGGIPLENIKAPVLLVMKKNMTPLSNLLKFLKANPRSNQLPLLLLDDEADNASVNAKKDEDPAKINSMIRELLGHFDRASYVAYTATPFANIFINPGTDDLFPSNFVYSLNSPTNYIGAGSIFLDDGGHTDQIVEMPLVGSGDEARADAELVFPERHKKDLVVAGLPDSLMDAVDTFLLSCAIRDLRGEHLRHRSMLVNVTRFTDVQARVAELIKSHLHSRVEEIKQYLADEQWSRHSSLCRLHGTWLEQYGRCGIPWDAIRKALYASVASVKVLTINQKSPPADRLNYANYRKTEKGRRVIAVGGLSLSRGLTLEGLCVSYFWRNSKAYDTLLQMGRWFGYRPGYADLCRIWMGQDAQDWFSHIAEVVDELRDDVRRMKGLKPRDFGMRVRSHPGALIVTAANKMRNSREVEVRLSFSGEAAETAFLPRRPDANVHNVSTVRAFLAGLPKARVSSGRAHWEKVGRRDVADLLSRLEISPMNLHFLREDRGLGRPLLDFIADTEEPSMQDWDVCLPSGEGRELPEVCVALESGDELRVKPRLRQFESVPSSADYLKLNRQRVGDVSDEKFGLSAADIAAVVADWEEEKKRDRARKPNSGPPGRSYRRFRRRPLLTIHLIQPKDRTSPVESGAAAQAGDPATEVDGMASKGPGRRREMMKASEVGDQILVAVSLSFPQFEERHDESRLVPYRLNRISLGALGLLDEVEGDDED